VKEPVAQALSGQQRKFYRERQERRADISLCHLIQRIVMIDTMKDVFRNVHVIGKTALREARHSRPRREHVSRLVHESVEPEADVGSQQKHESVAGRRFIGERRAVEADAEDRLATEVAYT